MLPEESIPEILSLMRTVDYMKSTEDTWKDDAEIAANSAHFNSLVEKVFSFMTEEEKNRILELYRQQVKKEKSAE
jgi:hypothetical protein